MSPHQGRRGLADLARRWRWRRRLARVLFTWAALVPGLVLAGVWGTLPLAILTVLAMLITAVVTLGTPKPGDAELTRYLDQALPELQNSSELLLRGEGLNLLEQLQQRRALDALARVDLHRGPRMGVVRGLQALALSSLVSVLLLLTAPALIAASRPNPATPGDVTNAIDTAPTGPLRRLEVTVEPPAYTRRARREEASLDLEVEEGSRVTWTIETSLEIDQVELVLDDQLIVLDAGNLGAEGLDTGDLDAEDPSTAMSPSTRSFSTRRRIDRPHLYHLRLVAAGSEAYRSPSARLEVLADTAPTLEIKQPKPFTEVDGERPGKLAIEALAHDDHGLTHTSLVVTLVAGSGEMVDFREQRFVLEAQPLLKSQTRQSEPPSWRLRHTLNLTTLGMEPGTELYFYLEGRDNRQPESLHGRSSTYIVRAPGSRRPSVDLGDGIPMVTLPEYFRSQRQIILDTQQLLADRQRITEQEFQQRSQELGLDQGALRLRYGALLGLEREGEIGPVSSRELAPEDGHDHEDDTSAKKNHDAKSDHSDHLHGGNDETDEPPGEERQFASGDMAETMAEVPESFFHAHDSSDVSTFFTSEVKTLLRSALREMWESEAHLRTFEPRDALPYENRALELIKRAQQAERVYVQRIGFDTPVVKPDEKRLTGELDQINSQRHRFDRSPSLAEPEVRRALVLIRQWRQDPSSLPGDFRTVLAAASTVLARRAVQEKNLDLEALDHLRRWSESGDISDDALASVEHTLWHLLPEPSLHPSRQHQTASPLFERYLEQLDAKPLDEDP